MKHAKEGSQLLTILMCMVFIVIIIVIAVVIGISMNKSNLQDNNLENNIDEDIADKNEDDEIIKVIIDEPQDEENNENSNENENNTVNPVKEDPKYYIKVNNKANVVTVYKKDSKGKYTVPIKAMICSIGDATPTSGVYKTSDMYTWRLLQGNVYGQYAVRITGHILFHSVPYVSQSKDTLEWWEYDKLGTAASLGCIRLTVEDAKWIYDNCEKGTQVEFYSSTNPGPLGKPTAKKISSYDENLKNWDPTDPDPNNPWNTYVETSTIPVTPEPSTPITPNVPSTTPEEQVPPPENTVETVTPPIESNVTDNNIIDVNLGIENV